MLDSFWPLYLILFLFTLLLTSVIEHYLIPYLRTRANQPIYEIGPSWHASKGATPTMGGLAFLIASTLSLLFSALYLFFINESHFALSLLIYTFLCVGNALIGLVDDLTKIQRKQNGGLTPKQKLLLQTIVAVIFLALNAKNSKNVPAMDLLGFKIDSFFLYFPISLIIILGIVNFANLTDGIDGLAASVAYAIGISFLLMSAKGALVSAILATVLIGSSVAFLFFNMNPAKIFMGDTGSLFLGALALSCAFSAERPLSIIPIGIIYVIEGASVILQVVFFKLTRKRLFKMAPIHHHFEKCGMSENKICLIAIIITLFSSLIALLTEL